MQIGLFWHSGWGSNVPKTEGLLELSLRGKRQGLWPKVLGKGCGEGLNCSGQ